MTLTKETLLSYFSGASVRNITKLVSGTASGQAITMLSSILIARIYQSADYGVSATFVTLTNMLIPLSMLRYDMTVLVADSDAECRDTKAICQKILLLFCVAAAIVLGVMTLFSWPNMIRVLGGYTWLVAPAVFVAASVTLSGIWLNRMRQYNVLSYSRPISALVAAAVSIIGGWLSGGNPLWIIVSFFVSFLVVGFFQSRHVVASQQQIEPHVWSAKAGWQLMVKYRQFPLYNLPMSFFDHVTKGLPILIFSSAFGAASAGALAFSYSVVRLPSNVISSAVEQVFMERASRNKFDISALRVLVIKCTLALSALSILPMFLLYAFGESIFVYLFGPSWQQAGQFSGVLIFAAAASLIVGPVFHLPSVLGKQRQQMIFFVTSCLFRIAAALVGGKLSDPVLALKLYVAVEVASTLLYLTWLLYFLKSMKQNPNHE